ncbi:MAG TPA: sigma 54-interacting transcriptional regulator [Smithella sp.]|mgnify:FL=1|nr:sigma 54-interacting transcriptional regulator [Smithella sp.]
MQDPIQTLKESIAAWSYVLDAAHNGIIIIDRHGVIVGCNEAARRIFNDGSVFLSAGGLFSDLSKTGWQDVKNILETGQPQIGKRINLHQGAIIVNRTPIVINGQIEGVVSIFQDISEYENIITELKSYQELHRRLEAIIESSYDGLYITDGKAKTLLVNSAYERITGISRNNLIGRNMKDLVKEKLYDHSVTLEVLKSKRSVTIMQHIKGGKEVIVTGAPIFDADGEISMVVTNVRDITELNQLRTQLEETRRLSSRYHQSILEQEELEHFLGEMVVKSTSMLQVVRKAIKVAKVDTSVMLTGESGVGKSMLARFIHDMSARRENPFVTINCGAIPESLIESELFGYEKGAFTGALPGGKAGLVEIGNKGTVFLDEIGELSANLQVKLLNVLENKIFTHVGGTKPVEVDIRIIAATNKNLDELVSKGLFREDLYYRVNVLPIHIPPLRERRDDIPALVTKIMSKINQKHKTNKRLDPSVLESLRKFNYPGNVRELINMVERMFTMSEDEYICLMDIPVPDDLREPFMNQEAEDGTLPLKNALAGWEAQLIKEAIRRHKTIAESAKSLRLHPTTLWRKMLKYSIK